MKKILLLLFFLSYLSNYQAQDVHWSQINENELYQNPANTGDFHGDFRASVSTKDQWRNLTKPYQTQAVTFDIINKYDRKLGYGGLFLHDVTGDGIFRTIEMKLTPAYTLYQNTIKKQKIRIGIDLDYKYNQMNFSNYTFDNQFNGLMYSSILPSNENFTTQQKSLFSIGTGITFTKEVSVKFHLKTGMAVFNINQADQGFYNIKTPRLRRSHFFVQSTYIISPKITLIPSFNLQLQGTYSEIILGSKCQFKSINFLPSYLLIGGIYFRNKDAIFTQIGLKINNITTTINYDINVSKLAKASNGHGGLEINCQYIWTRKEAKNLMHKKCLDYL